MVEYYEEQLDLTKNRITEIEKQIAMMQDAMLTVSEQLKETQRFLIKIAHSQSEVAKRVSTWPFVPVNHRDEK